MNNSLETDRLTLRRFTPDDLERLVELDSDPEVMRYLTGGKPTPRRAIETDILPRFIEGCYWAAIEKETGEFGGWFGLKPCGEDSKMFELGYRLRSASWGKGYATEGSLALIRKAFTEFDAERVTAHTYQDNQSSRRVMEKCGMRFVRSYRITVEDLVRTGTFDVDSNELWDGDDVEYAITREEWQRRST
jgi:RimJ/RimL family protein N-acetyltransferase